MLLLVLFIAFGFSPTSAQFTLLYQKDGDTTGMQLGYSVAMAGDVNGDGRTNFIVGTPFFQIDAGLIFVYSGADGSILHQKNGNVSDYFGISLAGAGDVNGDGKNDFIIGAYGTLGNSGSAYVYSGSDGSLLHQKDGALGFDELGRAVAGAGDVNGDGKADFIIGAPFANPGGFGDAGSAYVYSGATGALLYQKDGSSAGVRLGVSVAGAGDVNGDGRADFIVGVQLANAEAGSAFLYSGADGSLIYQKYGGATGDRFGSSLAGAGDVNGDGRADFIIGALFADPGGLDTAGSVYVYSGVNGSVLYQKNGAIVGGAFGQSVAGAGDVNGDGRNDFIVGAPGSTPGGLNDAGSVFLYSGADGSLLFQKDGVAVFDRLGWSVDGRGDINGDGRADIIIGAFGADCGGLTDAGSAFVYGLPAPPDPPVNLTPIYKKDGPGGFGSSVAGTGDVNGDGRSDFIIGAPSAPPGNSGSAFVYSGATGTLLHQKNGASVGDGFGGAVAGTGDINGDGKDDFIVGAPNVNGAVGASYVYSGITGDTIYYQIGVTGFGDPPTVFGGAVAGIGDVDGDGKSDFIVGASAASANGGPNAGRVYVYSGATGALIYERTCPNSSGNFGHSVGGAGDINADGRADFIVGAPDLTVSALSQAGSVFVYSGLDGALLFQKDADSAGARFGYSVGIAGDVNGDGRDDFIVGATWEGIDSTGRVFVYSGADGTILYQKSGARGTGGFSDLLGLSVGSAGDINGDGRDDFIVGAPSADPGGVIEAGAAYVYSGATGVLLAQINGTDSGHRLGWSVSGVGDINLDGKADVVVGNISQRFVFVYAVNRKPFLAPIGAPTGTEGQLLTFTVSATDPDGFMPLLSVADTSAGMAFADTGNGGGRFVWTPQPYQVGAHHVRFIASDGFLADTQMVTITVLADTLKAQKNGANAGDQFGSSIAGGGDVDGDGVADYIIGAPFADVGVFGEAIVLTDAGSAYVYSGKNDTLIYQVNGSTPGERVGGSVGLYGDVNLDGTDDFIIGAPGFSDSAGKVLVISGATGDTLHIITGFTGDRVGGSVGIGGDLDHDGHADFIVGAPGTNDSAGAAYVHSGDDGSLLFQRTGSSPGDRVGGSVGIFGDYVIIGAPGINSSAGAAFIDSGGAGVPIDTVSGSSPGDRVGGSVGIYTSDFIVGAPGTSGSAGSAFVYSLSTGNLRYQVNGSTPGDRIGGSVGINADVNRDGHDDFVVGAPGANDSAGAVYVYSGLDGSVLFQNFGDSTGERVGGSVGIFENLDGSEPRILIGAPGADPNGNQDAGSAFIFQTEKKGDLNGDGLLTPVDVVHMINCVFVGNSLGTDCGNLGLLDLNCDGLPTSSDVVLELNLVFLGAVPACSF